MDSPHRLVLACAVAPVASVDLGRIRVFGVLGLAIAALTLSSACTPPAAAQPEVEGIAVAAAPAPTSARASYEAPSDELPNDLRVAVRRIDASGFDAAARRGVVRLIVDATDARGDAVSAAEVESLALSIDAARVMARAQVRPAREVGPAHVAMLISAHRGYTFDDPYGAPDVMGPIEAGFRRLLGRLKAGRDRSSVWYLGAEGQARTSAWNDKHAPESVDRAALPEFMTVGNEAPQLYETLALVVREFDSDLKGASARRYLVVVTDGKDRVGGFSREIAARHAELINAVRSRGVHLVALGLTLDTPGPLEVFEGVVVRAQGTYRGVDPEADIASAVEGVAALVDGGLAIDLALEGYTRAAGPMSLRLELGTAGARGVATVDVDWPAGEAK